MTHILHLMNHFVNLSFELGMLTVQDRDVKPTKVAWHAAGDALGESIVTSRVPNLIWLLIYVFFAWVKCSWLLTKLMGEIIIDAWTH